MRGFPYRPMLGYFNPRSREGSDRVHKDGQSIDPNFNPRSREGSDIDKQPVNAEFFISIHAPVKGATAAYARRHAALRNFNPRSREGSDGMSRQQYLEQLISIHAPAKGATGYAPIGKTVPYISIHAPAKGATQVHAGQDQGTGISIHAPA